MINIVNILSTPNWEEKYINSERHCAELLDTVYQHEEQILLLKNRIAYLEAILIEASNLLEGIK